MMSMSGRSGSRRGMGCEVASTTVATSCISNVASSSFSAARPTLSHCKGEINHMSVSLSF